MFMSVRAGLALPAIAIVVSSLSLPVLSPNSAAAAQCLTAPNGQAPKGSHWYYRVERPSLRKCWRLVRKDQAEQPAVATTAPDETGSEAAPTPAASAPAAPVAEVAPAAAQAPIIRNLVTRNVSNPSEAAQPLMPPVPAGLAQDGEAANETRSPAQTQGPGEQPAPMAVEQPAAPAVTQPAAPATPIETANTADSDSTPTLKLLLLAIALLGGACGAGFLVLEIMRRRADVLNYTRDADPLPVEASPEISPDESALDAAPTFAPLPPIGLAPREDDVDAALRRFRNARRRAA